MNLCFSYLTSHEIAIVKLFIDSFAFEIKIFFLFDGLFTCLLYSSFLSGHCLNFFNKINFTCGIFRLRWLWFVFHFELKMIPENLRKLFARIFEVMKLDIIVNFNKFLFNDFLCFSFFIDHF